MCSACSKCSKVTFTSQFSDSLSANQAHESQIELIEFPNRLIIRSWLLFWIFARAVFFAPPACIGRWRLKDDALSKQLTKEINLNGFFSLGSDRLFQLFVLFVDDSRVTRAKQPKFERPPKRFICGQLKWKFVFFGRMPKTISLRENISHQFCFVFAFFSLSVWSAAGCSCQEKKTKDKTFIVPRRICFWISWLLNCTSQWVGSVVERTPKPSRNFACCQLNYVKRRIRFNYPPHYRRLNCLCRIISAASLSRSADSALNRIQFKCRGLAMN